MTSFEEFRANKKKLDLLESEYLHLTPEVSALMERWRDLSEKFSKEVRRFSMIDSDQALSVMPPDTRRLLKDLDTQKNAAGLLLASMPDADQASLHLGVARRLGSLRRWVGACVTLGADLDWVGDVLDDLQRMEAGSVIQDSLRRMERRVEAKLNELSSDGEVAR